MYEVYTFRFCEEGAVKGIGHFYLPFLTSINSHLGAYIPVLSNNIYLTDKNIFDFLSGAGVYLGDPSPS